MRLVLFILTTTTLSLFATGTYSQNAKVTIDMKNSSVRDVLSAIEKSSEFFFIYNNELIDVERKVDLNVRDQKISDVLARLFSPEEVEIAIMDRKIILAPAYMRAQQQKVTGTVTDASSGESIIGASVLIEGTTIGTVTDVNGKFSLDLPGQNAVLVISFLGYLPEKVEVNSAGNFDIKLLPDVTSLEEVVVVGYGIQKKANVSGAITSVNAKELHSLATNDAGQALQGKAPVFIARNSGKPGEGSSIFLRGVGTMGNSGPLWIVDGVQGAPLDNFNEVESIQILKDAASAAIYGVQAANGVILVTTRKAKKGKLTVNYNGYVKTTQAMGLPDLLDTRSYIDMYKQRWLANNPTRTETDMQATVKPFYFLPESELSNLPNTDWINTLFRSGMEQVHNLTLAGGNEKSTYLISLIHETDKGTVVNTDYAKSSVKLDFSQQFTKWLKVSETLNYRYSNRTPFPNEGTMWQGIYRGNPAMAIYDNTNPLGTGYGYFSDTFRPTIDWQGGNPLESLMMKDYWEKSDQAWGNIQTIITPMVGLSWTTNISGTISNNWSSKFNFNSFGGVSVNSENFVTGTPTATQFDYVQDGKRSYLINSYLNYDKSFGKHDLNLMIGTEVFESDFRKAQGFAKNGIPSQDLRTSAVATSRDGYNSWEEDSRYSQFGRFAYSFGNKYLLTATFRNDATSKFAPGKRQAFFPSLSIGWNIANESFFPVKNINDLKLRFGAGKLGNADVDPNLWRQEYVMQSNGTWNAQKVVNKDITWEKTSSVNVGIDVGVWQNALTASVDFYNKETKDALLNISLPTSSGFSSYYVNKGIIQNHGLEVMLGFKNSIGKVNFSVNANMAYNQNKVLDLGLANYLPGKSSDGLINNRTFANGPVSAFFGYVAEGLYQSQEEINALNEKAVAAGFSTYDGTVYPGDIKFKDINGDGRISADKDQTSIGNPWPKYVYGFNLNFDYAGVDLIMSWQGVADVDIYNGLLKYNQNMFSDWNSTAKVFDVWSPSNTASSIPQLGNSTHNYGQSNSYAIEDGSYLRLKNIQLGYSLSQNLISKFRVQKLRVYVGMENALTFTKFSGFDPEFMTGSNYNRGVYGLNQYPQSRTIVFGIQLGI